MSGSCHNKSVLVNHHRRCHKTAQRRTHCATVSSSQFINTASPESFRKVIYQSFCAIEFRDFSGYLGFVEGRDKERDGKLPRFTDSFQWIHPERFSGVHPNFTICGIEAMLWLQNANRCARCDSFFSSSVCSRQNAGCNTSDCSRWPSNT